MTIRARAALLGDRLVLDRGAQSRVISTAPFSFRKGDGYVVAFRYGAAVLILAELAIAAATLFHPW